MAKKIYIILGTIVALILVSIISVVIWYNSQIKGVSRTTSENKIVVEIKSGTSTIGILEQLQENNIIKNQLAAKVYIKLNGVKSLQAGKYEFSGNEDVAQVLKKISEGDVMDETVTITFKEGKNMRYIASEIAEKTNNTTKDVYNLLSDKDYISSLINKYWFITEDVQNKEIYYPLEGYLYPDTYSFANSDVEVKSIFEKMLDKTDKVLTKYKSTIDVSGYSVHEVLTMASIVELEGNNAANRAKIASVIYNRLKTKMSLGSDVTTYYAVKVDMGERNLYAKEINTYNSYNTRGPNMAGKLPVGPICSASEESITAVLNPDKIDYLYFVADKNGDIYFSKTYQEHQQTIATLQKKGLWYEYDN